MKSEDKKIIIDSLFKIISTATHTMSDSRVENNDYFKRRVLGFKGEIEFENLTKKYPKVSYLEGGQFISKQLSGVVEDKNSFIYTTLSQDEPELYESVYEIISKWDEVSEMFYIKINDKDWSERDFNVRESTPKEKRYSTKILLPSYTFFQFNKKTKKFSYHTTQDFSIVLDNFSRPTRNITLFPLRKREQFEYFNEYDIPILKKIYANRYFLDVILKQAKGRHIIDLDGFLVYKKSISIIEIKEKSPILNESINKDEWEYGWDSRRILWYLYLQKKVGLPILYNVRQINNRSERTFIQWDSIFLDDFLKGVGWSNSRGGGGGEDTLLAPHSFFRRLEEVLKDIQS